MDRILSYNVNLVGYKGYGKIPTWALGRKFGRDIKNKLVTFDFAPPYSLEFGMGIWGSAVSINLEYIMQGEGFKDLLTKLVASSVEGEAKVSGEKLEENISDIRLKVESMIISQVDAEKKYSLRSIWLKVEYSLLR